MSSETYTLDRIEGEGEALDLLIRRAQEGEEGAFEEILSRFEGRALALAHHLGASRTDAEDIAQESFLRLFRHIDSYQGGRRFTAWFYRIVINVTRDHLRRTRSDLTASGAGEGADQSAEPHPLSGLVAAERRDQVRRALQHLTDREREVIILREIQGLSTWQVARILRVNPITVRRHAMRARERLRELLGGE